MTDFVLGDLVVCATRAVREQMGLAVDVGIYLIDRKRDGLVYFPGPERSVWLIKGSLRPADLTDPRILPPPEWLLRVHRAVRLLDGIDLTIEKNEEGLLEARITCLEIDGNTWRAMEELAGSEAKRLRVRPGSMSRILVVLPLAAVPATPSG